MKYRLLKNKEIERLLNILVNEYIEAKCGLEYTNAFELLISLILAAQCTDIRVNKIRPILTKKYPTPESIKYAKKEDIYELIKSCSFPNNKTKSIIGASKKLVDDFNSIVPNTMEDLISIPGIGRKSANIILSECFNSPVGIAVDTHVKRTSKRIGFTLNTNVNKIENDLVKKIPRNMWKDINHILVCHGRATCTARNPQCNICILNDLCKKNI